MEYFLNEHEECWLKNFRQHRNWVFRFSLPSLEVVRADEMRREKSTFFIDIWWLIYICDFPRCHFFKAHVTDERKEFFDFRFVSCKVNKIITISIANSQFKVQMLNINNASGSWRRLKTLRDTYQCKLCRIFHLFRFFLERYDLSNCVGGWSDEIVPLGNKTNHLCYHNETLIPYSF